jgi:hypothetical protein
MVFGAIVIGFILAVGIMTLVGATGQAPICPTADNALQSHGQCLTMVRRLRERFHISADLLISHTRKTPLISVA